MKREKQTRPRATAEPARADQGDAIAALEARCQQLELRMAAVDAALRGATQRRAKDGHSGFWVRGKGRELVLARHAAGWTQRGLAGALGVSHHTVSLWETDKVDVPLWRAKQVVDCFAANEAEPPAWPIGEDEG